MWKDLNFCAFGRCELILKKMFTKSCVDSMLKISEGLAQKKRSVKKRKFSYNLGMVSENWTVEMKMVNIF